jgi:glucan phosphoethanolaminetransferase (alkaline phosphatase superfamily)
MYPSNVVGAVALLFILAMAILRIRMQYARGAQRRLRLTGVGAAYFAVLVVLLGGSWFVAPRFGDGTAFQVTLARVVAFLAVYFLCIPAHRLLQAMGAEVFKTPVADIQRSC